MLVIAVKRENVENAPVLAVDYLLIFAAVTLVFFSLFPIAIPVVFMLLHVGVSFIQTYIFVLLATVYIGEAVAHEH